MKPAGPARALVVIDPQMEYFQGPLTIGYPPVDESLDKILNAIDTAIHTNLPIVVVRHENPPGAAAFGKDSPAWALHPSVIARLSAGDVSRIRHVSKRFASVFDGTDLAQQLADWGVDTVTFVGYMTNNCVLASAAAAAPLGLSAEVLSDATGAIGLANAAGNAPARVVQETLMTLLDSNFAAVTDTATWAGAVAVGEPLPKSNLVASARAFQGSAADA